MTTTTTSHSSHSGALDALVALVALGNIAKRAAEGTLPRNAEEAIQFAEEDAVKSVDRIKALYEAHKAGAAKTGPEAETQAGGPRMEPKRITEPSELMHKVQASFPSAHEFKNFLRFSWDMFRAGIQSHPIQNDGEVSHIAFYFTPELLLQFCDAGDTTVDATERVKLIEAGLKRAKERGIIFKNHRDHDPLGNHPATFLTLAEVRRWANIWVGEPAKADEGTEGFLMDCIDALSGDVVSGQLPKF